MTLLRGAIFYIRWQVARGLVWSAIAIAPSGPAKVLLCRYLNAYGAEIMMTLAANRKRGKE